MTTGDGRLGDAVALERLRAGDEALFRQVVEELTPVLMRLAREYTSSAWTAQDAVQDTWVTVLDKLDGFEGRSSLKTWVCGILVHTARRHGVREARTLPFSSAWRDDHGPAVDPARFSTRYDEAAVSRWSSPPVRWDEEPEERLAASELRAALDTAISTLPLRQREVIIVRDVLGMDAAEAAAVLGLTAGNERVLLHRARSKVRAAVEQYTTEALTRRPGPATGRERPRRPAQDRRTS